MDVGGERGEAASEDRARDAEYRALEEDGWDFIHATRSLNASVFAGAAQLVLDLWSASGPHAARCAAVVAGYWLMLWLAVVLSRRGHRRQEAIPPPDGAGSGRWALVFAALALGFGGGEAERASWLAAGAVLLGGAADGAWIARISVRQSKGVWRVLGMLAFGEAKGARLCWGLLHRPDRPPPGRDGHHGGGGPHHHHDHRDS